jgi:hypothetical protein
MATADAPPTLVWIAPEPPDGAQSRALETWARSRGVTLTPPSAERPRALGSVDGQAAAADEVEKLLDRARDAMAARDGDAVDAALATAEATLRAQPELPQAAWLMAEVYRTRSARFRRVPPLDDAAAERAWARAEAIDGGRVTGVGEQAGAAHPAAASIVLSTSGASGLEGATLLLDGVAVRPGVLSTREGAHTLVVAWDGTPVWATWIDAPAGSSTVSVTAPTPPACSTSDVQHAQVAAGTIDGSRVRCASWVGALPGPTPGSVLVAACEPGRCGPLLEWHAPPSWSWTPPPETPHHRWPSWATWGLVGAGAVVATGVVLLATGAFQPAPTETRFASGGVKSQ